MKTNDFLSLLNNNESKEVVFEYETGQYVPKAYHITEIKNVAIQSVDCGGRPHSEKQTVVQLWHDGKEKGNYMTAKTANKIFNIVDKVTPMTQDAKILFEYGNTTMRTSHFEVQEVVEKDNQIVLQLFVQPTVCKPKFELELAGVCSPGSGCC